MPSNHHRDDAPDAARRKAFTVAYNTYADAIHYYAKRFTQDEHLQRDLMQKFWLHVYLKFPVEDFFKLGILKRKFRQICIDHYRATQTRAFVETVEEPELFEVPAPRVGAYGTDDERVIEHRFWEQFLPLKLDPIDRKCFWLKNRYGYTLKEVGEMVRLPESTVHDRVNKVKAACAERLNDPLK